MDRSPERIGSVLRSLAADLVAERRRVLLLRRENRELKARLAELTGGADGDRESAENDAGEDVSGDGTEQVAGAS